MCEICFEELYEYEMRWAAVQALAGAGTARRAGTGPEMSSFRGAARASAAAEAHNDWAAVLRVLSFKLLLPQMAV